MQKASHDTVPWLTASSHTAIIPRKRNGRETREGIAPKGNMTKEVIQGNEL